MTIRSSAAGDVGHVAANPMDTVRPRSRWSTAMPETFKIGDHVRWNSEAGLVSGVIIRKLTSQTLFKGYVHHASKDEPQYMIKSDKTDHIAIHKGSALRLIRGQQGKKR
jgi:hypothetical protein